MIAPDFGPSAKRIQVGHTLVTLAFDAALYPDQKKQVLIKTLFKVLYCSIYFVRDP
jgi:hypothetical protein